MLGRAVDNICSRNHRENEYYNLRKSGSIRTYQIEFEYSRNLILPKHRMVPPFFIDNSYG